MRSFLKSRAQSLRYAFAGWWFVIRTQRNAWIHAIATLIVILLSFWLHLKLIEWAVIFIAIALVWTAEFLNTAMEALVDLASPNRHQLARICKDVGAAAVLIAALSSVLIGLFILGPHIWQKIQEIF